MGLLNIFKSYFKPSTTFDEVKKALIFKLFNHQWIETLLNLRIGDSWCQPYGLCNRPVITVGLAGFGTDMLILYNIIMISPEIMHGLPVWFIFSLRRTFSVLK